MDEELRHLLEQMRQENAAAHQETRQLLRQENAAAHQETRQLLRQENAAAHQETRQYTETLVAELRQENAQAHVVTRRHFDVNVERMDHRYDALAEAFLLLDEKVDRRLTRVEEALERTAADTQAMIKFSHSELDRRIRILEDTVSNLQ